MEVSWAKRVFLLNTLLETNKWDKERGNIIHRRDGCYTNLLVSVQAHCLIFVEGTTQPVTSIIISRRCSLPCLFWEMNVHVSLVISYITFANKRGATYENKWFSIAVRIDFPKTTAKRGIWYLLKTADTNLQHFGDYL